MGYQNVYVCHFTFGQEEELKGAVALIFANKQVAIVSSLFSTINYFENLDIYIHP